MRLLLTVFTLSLCCVGVLAQDTKKFAEYKKQKSLALEQLQTKQDQEFATLLQQQWRSFQSFKANMRPVRNKPRYQPIVGDKSSLIATQKSTESTKYESSVVDRNPVLKFRTLFSQRDAKTIADSTRNSHYQIYFYGHTLDFPKKTIVFVPQHIRHSKTIANYWLKIAKLPLMPVIESLAQYRNELQLSDWALIELVDRWVELNATQIFDANRAIIKWYILNKLSLDIRAGLLDKEIALLFSSNQIVFGRNYFLIGGKKYYLYDESISSTNGARLASYPEDTSLQLKPIKLDFQKSITYSNKEPLTVVEHQLDSLQQVASFNVSEERISFLNRYPKINITAYFASNIPSYFMRSITKHFDPLTKNLSNPEKVSYFLNWIQSLPYATDQEQFGEERYLLPEQALFYGKSDCEDRSILLSLLVKHYTPFDIVAVSYPNHISTAIKLPLTNANQNYDTVKVNGLNYVIADPTYKGAPIGKTMPDLAGINPKVITY